MSKVVLEKWLYSIYLGMKRNFKINIQGFLRHLLPKRDGAHSQKKLIRKNSVDVSMDEWVWVSLSGLLMVASTVLAYKKVLFYIIKHNNINNKEWH
jgi:hypothetical protein